MRAADDDDPVRGTQDSYAVLAEAYAAKNAQPTPEYAAWRDGWAAALPPGARVLDAGAGPGQHSAAFAAAGLRPVAADLSPAMAALARRAVPPWPGAAAPAAAPAVVLADLRRLPFADAAFAGVWASASLLHVPRADTGATLREWRRVTADGGALALSTATGGIDGWEDPPYDTGDVRPPPRWFVYHDEPELRGLLVAAGWAVGSVWHGRSHRGWLRVDARAR